jgi:hypothetical protein
MPHIQYNPADILLEAAQINNSTLAKYQEFFSYHNPLSLELLNLPLPFTHGPDLDISNSWQHALPKIQGPTDPIQDGYMPVLVRLCLILSFLPESRPVHSISAESPLLPELARYIFTFPVQCYVHFASMIQQSDSHALLLLYHFYRAVRILLPPGECWWANKRASVSETASKKWLMRESATCTRASC